MEIGTKIRAARNAAGLTQEQAAEALHVSRQTVSNWENGRSYPDIVSVIHMSDLYSISLDHLLKEDVPVKQSYMEYLKESTDTVKSNEKKAKLILVLGSLGIWALSLVVFWLIVRGPDTMGYGLIFMWAVLPAMFFIVSYIIGRHGYFGRLKYLAPVVFSLMYSLSGYTTYAVADQMVYKTVMWPDFAKLPLGLVISFAGLGLGLWLSHREKKRKAANAEN